MGKTATTSISNKTPASEVLSRFNASWEYAKSHHHRRWKRNRKLYNNERAIVSYEGITDTFVPMTFSTVETMTAALAAGRPSIDFVPYDMYKYVQAYAATGEKPDMKALNAQFDYYWDCDNWDLKTVKTVRNGLIDGISGEWIYWDGDKPRIINMLARDILVDPSVSDPMQLLTNPKDHWVGRRFMTTLSKLRDEEIVDPDKPGKTKKRYKNLHFVKPGYSPDEEDPVRRDMFTGLISADNDAVEVIEIWDGEKIRSIANRSTTYLIEDRPNEVGILPLGLCRFIADENVLYGKSIIDPIAQPQELLNDVTNQSVDAVTDALNPQKELDPAYADYLPMVAEAGFGTIFPFAPGSLQPIRKDVVPNSAFNERQNMKNEIREATGADQIVQGVTADGATTATEIRAQLNQAGQRFELYNRMLEKEALYHRAKIVYALMRHYQTDRTLVPVMTKDGPKFRRFDPAQYDETLEPRIQLESTIQYQKARDEADYSAAYKIMIQDPTNDLWEAKKVLYPKMFKLSEEELDKIIGSQKPETQAGAVTDEDTPPGAEADATDLSALLGAAGAPTV